MSARSRSLSYSVQNKGGFPLNSWRWLANCNQAHLSKIQACLLPSWIEDSIMVAGHFAKVQRRVDLHCPPVLWRWTAAAHDVYCCRTCFLFSSSETVSDLWDGLQLGRQSRQAKWVRAQVLWWCSVAELSLCLLICTFSVPFYSLIRAKFVDALAQFEHPACKSALFGQWPLGGSFDDWTALFQTSSLIRFLIFTTILHVTWACRQPLSKNNSVPSPFLNMTVSTGEVPREQSL